MPSSTEDPSNQEDTPDEAKPLKSLGAGRKKKAKKAVKNKTVDECKDSSSEDPKPSPEL